MTLAVASSTSERKFVDLVVDEVVPDGTFSGYASLFGHADLGRDVVERGAFAASLRKRGVDGVRMLYQHDANEPIGSWTELREDARGLFVRGQLSTRTARGREVLELMRMRALDGLSIGFRTVKSRSDPQSGTRRIVEADLWEISVVTFPMLPEARVETVKGGRLKPFPTTREFERWLTRDACLTRSEARMVIAKGFSTLRRERDAAMQTENGLAAQIRRATRMLKTREELR
ncbi:HK97 family phage prohead protease [Aquamicrobium sp. LC103]|uniref:HK97 family phage prohead protease n=1 Tax=Aquamicrobium sp. LC103 TaxID=1120658 RepID=UPI00063E6E31|nr:HK97 family phage prohead protease [Aquamicrobium sp. LC103]TKT81224.1 HK97 family phage prohead protease [Aquamicrobium sp. LC103]